MNRGLRSGFLLLLVAGLVVVTGLEARAQTPKKGGVLRVAVLGDPPTLDSHWTTANFVEVITQHIYESLYTLDQNYQPIPVLAEALPAVSADGLTYTIKLRQGIRFHNGKEMTSEDVVASLKRWGGYAAQAKAMWASVEGVRAVDRSTVEIKLKEKSGIVLISLANANNFSAVYPKEIAEKYPTPAKVTEYIGTGPFKFVEWKPDVHIRMVRYDDYKPRAEAANGYGGRKVAYVDEIRWIPMPEVATRVASLESGEVDFADDLQAVAYDRLKDNPKLRPLIVRPYAWAMAVFNKKEGLMTNIKLRQAVQAAVDIEPVTRAAVGNPLFYRLDSGLAFTEQTAWHSKAGGDAYNQRNKDKAKRLLQEAGYKGEPVRFITTKEYEWMYNIALVTKQQLEDVGMTIDLQVVDWATLVQRPVRAPRDAGLRQGLQREDGLPALLQRVARQVAFGHETPRVVRRVTSLAVLLVWVIGGIPAYGYAQGKKACDLLTRADVEAILGVTLEEPTSTPDGSSCSFTNWSPNKPRPSKWVDVQVLVNYSTAPDPAAVEKWRKMIDEKTYHNSLDLPDIGDVAFWHGSPQYATVTVFTGGTLVLTYRDGLGVPANPATALELLRKAAMAGYVPAMVPLAYVYFAAGTPVSPQRRNYWAQQAAEKSDPAGWTLTGYLYNKGQLGGGPPHYYKMAMNAYLKGADGGDCLAMMNICGLYFNGNGVPQDRALAQTWFQKAEACQGKDLDWMREKAAKYRQRAASGRLPALQEVKPESQKPAGGQKMTMADAEKVFAGFLALMVIGAALDIANGSADGTGGSAVTGSSPGSSPGVSGSRGSAPAPVRHCRQVQVGSFSTQHGKGAISPSGATTTVCD